MNELVLGLSDIFMPRMMNSYLRSVLKALKNVCPQCYEVFLKRQTSFCTMLPPGGSVSLLCNQTCEYSVNSLAVYALKKSVFLFSEGLWVARFHDEYRLVCLICSESHSCSFPPVLMEMDSCQIFFLDFSVCSV